MSNAGPFLDDFEAAADQGLQRAGGNAREAVKAPLVADTLETPELFDVDVNDLARALALFAALRLGRLQIAHPV